MPSLFGICDQKKSVACNLASETFVFFLFEKVKT